MRRFFAVLGLLLAMSAAHAQGGLSDIFRSVTGALRGGRETAPQQQGVTPVIGVRGMDEADAQAAAGPASDEIVLMEGWAAIKAEALAAAKRRGLAARPVDLKKAAETIPAKPN